MGVEKKRLGKILFGGGSQWEEEFGVRTEEKWKLHGIAFAIGYGVKAHGMALVIG